MHKISSIIITYNKEKNIRGCLESVNWVDEIVIVDSFSNDKTIDMCKECNVKIFQNKWPGHDKQKNFALDKTTHDWVISLDADERLTPELSDEIKQALNNDKGRFEGYIMPRHSYYLGRWINHGEWYPNYQLRLFNRQMGRWENEPHGRVRIKSRTKYLKGKILHYSYENINEHIYKIANFTSIMANIDYEEGKRFSLFKLILMPILKFFNS